MKKRSIMSKALALLMAALITLAFMPAAALAADQIGESTEIKFNDMKNGDTMRVSVGSSTDLLAYAFGAEQYSDDRIAYTDGKKDIIDRLLAEARVWKIESSKDFHDAVLSHQEPICPACGKGRIICPQGKIKKPHYFECSNNCGWHMNVDYKDCLVE